MQAERIATEVFAELPQKLRKSGTPSERLAAGKSATPAGSFLEGPSFDRQGNLHPARESPRGRPLYSHL